MLTGIFYYIKDAKTFTITFISIYLYENLTMFIDYVKYNDFINLYNEL